MPVNSSLSLSPGRSCLREGVPGKGDGYVGMRGEALGEMVQEVSSGWETLLLTFRFRVSLVVGTTGGLWSGVVWGGAESLSLPSQAREAHQFLSRF